MLRPIDDAEIFPEIPAGVHLTMAPEGIEGYIKYPGLVHYETKRSTNVIPTEILSETLSMETLRKALHPNIIQYYGCRVRAGRITSIVLEHLDKTLEDCAATTSSFRQLDADKICEKMDETVSHIHGLGLAHNDISSLNIMLRKDGEPVLIDFGGCQPVGKKVQSLGSPGWREKPFWTSEYTHDEFSLGRLREWFKETAEEHSALENGDGDDGTKQVEEPEEAEKSDLVEGPGKEDQSVESSAKGSGC